MTFSAFLFLLKLSVSHNDHEMLSFIRNTLFTESLQIDFITKNSVVSCHPLPYSQTGLALNSVCEYLRGQVLCSGGSVGTGRCWKEVGPWFGSSLKGLAQEKTHLWPWAARSWLMGTSNPAVRDSRSDVMSWHWCSGASRATWSLGKSRCLQMLQLEMQTFLLGLSGDHGQGGSCWPSPCQCHTGVAMS